MLIRYKELDIEPHTEKWTVLRRYKNRKVAFLGPGMGRDIRSLRISSTQGKYIAEKYWGKDHRHAASGRSDERESGPGFRDCTNS